MVESDTIVESTRLKRPVPEKRFGFLLALLVVVMGVIIGRSFQLQVLQGKRWQVQAEENRVAVLPVPAPRGIIYDRHGQQLLENIASTDIVLDPTLLPGEEDETPLFDLLPGIAEITHDDVRTAVATARERGRVTLLAVALPHDDVIKIESILARLPGVRLVSSSVRNYLYGQSLSHVLGYTSLADERELAMRSDLLASDVTGKSGIEKQYDFRLRGKRGASYVEVDAAGQPRRDVREEAAVPGEDLNLTINIELQQFIYNLLAERDADPERPGADKSLAGAVVVLETDTGAVQALVSYPAFDPNVFSQPARRSETSLIFDQPTQPLFNRAISGTYPPGSAIKPLLAVAGLEEGIITQQTTFLSTGGIRIGEWFFPDWKTGGHGATDVRRAIAESVNTFFYLLIGGDETRVGLGVRKATDWLKVFSWGQFTEIDLPEEATGFLPSPEWKEKVKNERWYIGDTYHLGIGQGDVLVTPLQVAVATAALANYGTIYRPHLIDEVDNLQGRQLPISRRHLDTVRDGMRAAVLEGSARRLNSLPVELAGKTGTAQVGNEDDTHAWFTSFGPYNDPKLVVTVLLERGGNGDTDAVPVAEKIWQWWADVQK
ncbi:MAG: penicillin-binding protein 2 [bacterium]